MSEKVSMHCRFLDGTDAMQCRWEGPYKYTRNKPSLTNKAFGDKQTSYGVVKKSHFFHCIPALIKRSMIDSQEADKYSYEWLVDQQSKCTKFEQPT